MHGKKDWIKPIKIKNEKNKSIGIIGAGPAGLACAEQLRKDGYQITFMIDMIDQEDY